MDNSTKLEKPKKLNRNERKTKHFKFKNTKIPKITVEIAPPIKPSHVFFGDSLIKGVRPKKKPKTYAIMSLHIIMETGTKNLKICKFKKYK